MHATIIPGNAAVYVVCPTASLALIGVTVCTRVVVSLLLCELGAPDTRLRRQLRAQ